MTEQDLIKREALEKLDTYVKENIRCCRDINEECCKIVVDESKLDLSPEHIGEIRPSIAQLTTEDGFRVYCRNRGIEL